MVLDDENFVIFSLVIDDDIDDVPKGSSTGVYIPTRRNAERLEVSLATCLTFSLILSCEIIKLLCLRSSSSWRLVGGVKKAFKRLALLEIIY